jgi:Fur family peroxide stress response transcriptional regulator
MKAHRHPPDERQLTVQLGATGLRLTPQRQQVYDVLRHKRDHPTAEEVFIRAKKAMPDISHATVYNCLDALVKSGLARQVTVERGAARFCPNMAEHGHFHCGVCGTIYDVDLPRELPGVALPRGFQALRHELAIHGVCADCARKKE